MLDLKKSQMEGVGRGGQGEGITVLQNQDVLDIEVGYWLLTCMDCCTLVELYPKKKKKHVHTNINGL